MSDIETTSFAGPDRFHFSLQPLPAPEHHRERQFSQMLKSGVKRAGGGSASGQSSGRKLYTHTPMELSGGQQQSCKRSPRSHQRSDISCAMNLRKPRFKNGGQYHASIGLNKNAPRSSSVTHDPNVANYTNATIRIVDGCIAS